MKFYDLHIEADSLKETIRLAQELGWSGLGIIIPYDKDFSRKLEDLRKKIQGLKPRLDIVLGVEIPGEKPAKIRGIAKNLRKGVELILVSGGDLEVNRRALEAPEVDILTHPSLERNDPGIDHVMAKLAVKNSTAIEFSFNEILYAYKKRRSQVLKNFLETAKLVKKYKAPFIISSGAREPWDLRSPSELIALCRVLGLGSPEIKGSLSGEIVQENRKRLNKNWVMPGVEVE